MLGGVATEADTRMTGYPVVLRDRRRFLVLEFLAVLFVLAAIVGAAGVDSTADRVGIAVAFGAIAVLFVLAAGLKVEVHEDGVRLRSYVRRRAIPWSDIARFGRERMPGRLSTVPVVVLMSGKRHVIYGLDSLLSGFGASSPLWDKAIAFLTDELSRRRTARWAEPTNQGDLPW